jgi:hypothetical protein
MIESHGQEASGNDFNSGKDVRRDDMNSLLSGGIFVNHLRGGSDKLTLSSASLVSCLPCSPGNPEAGRYSGGMLYCGGTNGTS